MRTLSALAALFTVGVGTPEGSLIPISGEDGGTAFVKDSAGQVVKSKLDEKRLREIAQASGGFYLHLENGPRTMQQIYTEGLAKMQAAEFDVRWSRRPIERYEWPLDIALLALATSILIGERKRVRERIYSRAPAKIAAATAALLVLFAPFAFAVVSGLEAYRKGEFGDAYTQFQQTLQAHPQSRAEDKLHFDSGAAAYKMKDYGKALESFSQALLSPDRGLQSKSHYNLGNTLYEHGETQKSDDKKLSDWANALQHYEQTLKVEPQNKEAKENYEYVKKKIEELKEKREQPPPPSPSPSPQSKPQKNENQNQQNNQNQQQQSSSQDRQQEQKDQEQQQQSQAQNKPENGENQRQESKQDQSQAKNEPQKNQPQPGESPSPSPSPGKGENKDRRPLPGKKQAEESPSPGEGENESPSPSPGEGEEETPSPGEGEGSGEDETPTATPSESAQRKFAGELKGAASEKPEKPPDQTAQIAEAEPEKEGQMSERQAEALLQSMKDEEARVRLDEHKAARHVYNDW